MLGEIATAIEQQDAERMRRGAHTLKGSASVFAAERVVQQALQLENNGRNGDLSQAEELFESLSAEVDTLVTAIQSWDASQSS